MSEDKPTQIVIDMAGFEITPEMMDKTRDFMIETLIKNGTKMRLGLEKIVELAGTGASPGELASIAAEALPK